MNNNCPNVLDLLVEYLEGDLIDAQVAEIQQHLGDCPSCEAFIESYRITGKICKSALLQTMPVPLENALLDYLKSKIQG